MFISESESVERKERILPIYCLTQNDWFFLQQILLLILDSADLRVVICMEALGVYWFPENQVTRQQSAKRHWERIISYNYRSSTLHICNYLTIKNYETLTRNVFSNSRGWVI